MRNPRAQPVSATHATTVLTIEVSKIIDYHQILQCPADQLCCHRAKVMLHYDVVAPFRVLQEEASKQGFDLSIASAYRSLDRQAAIWNDKVQGLRAVLDDNSEAIDVLLLAPLERIEKIMRWSALPGTSRHHWGSDIDIYDRSAIAEDYKLQLTESEYSHGGPFAPMIDWLNTYLGSDSSPDFFFPYTQDRGGVMPEPWHLSYRPVAEQFQALWSVKTLAAFIRQFDILEKDAILANLDYLYSRFIKASIMAV
ncbi:MAG: M15 family metallopeptidase [Pseudomonadota bacterium]